MKESELIEVLKKACDSILWTNASYDRNSFDNLAYEYHDDGPVTWLEFFGSKDEKFDVENILKARQIFQSICIANQVIFIFSPNEDDRQKFVGFI